MILGGGKMILAGGEIILTGGEIILAGGEIVPLNLDADWSSPDDPASYI